jgi:hypothetical protein
MQGEYKVKLSDLFKNERRLLFSSPYLCSSSPSPVSVQNKVKVLLNMEIVTDSSILYVPFTVCINYIFKNFQFHLTCIFTFWIY